MTVLPSHVLQETSPDDGREPISDMFHDLQLTKVAPESGIRLQLTLHHSRLLNLLPSTPYLIHIHTTREQSLMHVDAVRI